MWVIFFILKNVTKKINIFIKKSLKSYHFFINLYSQVITHYWTLLFFLAAEPHKICSKKMIKKCKKVQRTVILSANVAVRCTLKTWFYKNIATNIIVCCTFPKIVGYSSNSCYATSFKLTLLSLICQNYLASLLSLFSCPIPTFPKREEVKKK